MCTPTGCLGMVCKTFMHRFESSLLNAVSFTPGVSEIYEHVIPAYQGILQFRCPRMIIGMRHCCCDAINGGRNTKTHKWISVRRSL
jgi:hypothetical protein